MKTMKNLKFLFVALFAIFSLSMFASVEVKKIDKNNLTEFVKTQNVIVSQITPSVLFQEANLNFVQKDLIFTNSNQTKRDVILEKSFYLETITYRFSDNYKQIKMPKSNYVIDKQKILYDKGILYNHLQI